MGKQFKDKVVVITGASAEGGIGWCTAERFAEEGARVIVAARTLAEVERLARKIGGQALRCDVSKEADVIAVAEAGKALGGIDIAVNSAGKLGMAMVANFEQAALEESMAINFYGNLYFFRHMAAAMPRGGSIASIASITVTQVVPSQLLYACAKSATVTAARYAAHEFAPKGIRVNMLIPGLVDTPLVAPLTKNPAMLAPWLKESPLHRICEPDEIANTLLWLAASPSVTGTSILIDGGIGLRRPPQLDEFPFIEYAKDEAAR